MSALLDHIQEQQDVACRLCGVLDAIELLRDEERSSDAVYQLIKVAMSMAKEINRNLDSVALPEGGEA